MSLIATIGIGLKLVYEVWLYVISRNKYVRERKEKNLEDLLEAIESRDVSAVNAAFDRLELLR